MRKIVLITVLVLLVYLILAFFAGTLLGLEGMKLWVLRIALWLVGLIGAAAILWYYHQKIKAEKAEEEQEPLEESDEIAALIKEAETRLASSSAKAQLGGLPVIFVIGETGTAKTSTVANSGLDAELLAGQVYHDQSLIPTGTGNIWYSQKAVFVELAGKSVNESGLWATAAKRLQPGRLRSAFRQGPQASRVALVMVDAEKLIAPGAPEALAALSRSLRARLLEISQTLGINLPVYVLFTKMDRVPFFAEYVRNLDNEEAAQVVGATLPMLASAAGVYGEREAARLKTAFEELFRGMADCRTTFLSREQDNARSGGIYEFPREFRKIRTNAVQFLVDLCRPSQLTVSPFLRGFYLSGVRPVVVQEVAPVVAAPQARRDPASGATGIFQAPAAGYQEQQAQKVVGTRRVPQWVFLTHLFHHVLLGDKAAAGVTAASTKTSVMRRVLFGLAAALLLCYSVALIVSYSRNKALESRAATAAHALEGMEVTGVKAPSIESLRNLDSLRQSLVQLGDYRRDGAPWSMRWGLFAGEDAYPEVRRLYFDCFRRLLFGQTQATLVDTLRGLPATPGPEYAPTYDTLKAYLITTSEYKRSTREFLSPVLLDRWSTGKNVDADRTQLAQKQFDFYADELRSANPYSTANEADTVAKARTYLNQFAGVERVYAALLADASKNSKSVNFNKVFPGSEDTVLDRYEVAGPFTKPGWDFVRKSLKNPEKYFSGEPWVLGEQQAAAVDKGTLGKELADRYYSDFVKQWRNYLKAAQVVKYANLQDAAKKLNVLSGNQSTLLALFALASANTAVDEPDVAKNFQPVQQVVPPGNLDKFIAPPNQAYMNSLLTLQASVEKASEAPQLTEQVATATFGDASAAKMITKQVAQGFRPDKDGRVDAIVQQLMEDPITKVEALLRRIGPDELNGKGKDLCAQYRKLLTKYPFSTNPDGPQATLAEFNSIFKKPEGALWVFYEGSLQKVLPKQGNQYVPAATPGITLNPAFVKFFNEAASFSEMLYPAGSPDPQISFSLKPVPMEGIQGVGLRLDAQAFSYSGGPATPKAFVWKGSATHEARATVKLGGPEVLWSTNDGLWAIFQFFAKAEVWRPISGGHSLDWIIRVGQGAATLPNGNPLTVRFELDMGGNPPVFQKGYLGKMACIADVAK